MSPPDSIGACSPQRWSRLRGAWALLLEAYDDALDVGRDPWEFAVARADLRSAGASDSALRWMRCQGWIRLAAERVVRGGTSRRFRPLETLQLDRSTCAILTESGVRLTRQLVALREPQPPGAPHWDGDAQELRYQGQLIKRFRLPAPNQALVLAVFEEEGWPCRIDDPLPPLPDQDPKRRLLDTIKCLNRGQHHRLLRFHGDGRGRGVRWRTLVPHGEG